MPDVGTKGPFAAGDNIDVLLTIFDVDGATPLDLTGKGVTFVLTTPTKRLVKRNTAAGGSSAEIVDTDPTQGKATVHLLAADLGAPGTHPFSVHVTFAPAQVKTPIWGRIQLINTESL